MSTLEDKILGEKLHNYCSSSENSDNEDSGDDFPAKNEAPLEEAKRLPEANKWEGSSTNTGPKGVIEDWRKFKQLETEKLGDSRKELTKLAEKLTMTVHTALDEEKEREAAKEDPELADLLNDDFLLNYRKQRMEEMLKQTNLNKKFGDLIFLRTSQEFLDAVDNEDKTVTVIVHIYEEHVAACRTMNECLKTLSEIYDSAKFCAILASRAGVSRNFKVDGLPAILVYKAGHVIGNFVKLTDDFGQQFQAEDVQSFLVEHGLLEDQSLTPALIRSSTAADKSDDSD